MKHIIARSLLLLSMGAAVVFQALGQTPPPSLRGTVTDPSGAVIPGALVQLVGPRGEQRQGTGNSGQYAFLALPAGKYQARFIAKGFTVAQREDIDVSAPVTLDVQLTLEANSQVVNVAEEANRVSTSPTENADAVVLSGKGLDALSDDPDLLQQQLNALVGPTAGPNGGQIYVDGFSGAQLPPKASIQEIRINSNPYSPEFDSPGSSTIQIITKPGTNIMHASISGIYNKEALNSRSPLLKQSKRPQYKQEQIFGNISGALKKNKLSYTLNFTKNDLVQNAFVLATTLDSNLNPVQVNQTVLTPRGNWNWSPRVDYSISPSHTLTVSFFNGHNRVHNLGVGDFGLPSRGYSNHGNNNQIQISETWIVNPHMVTDTRFQYFRNLNGNTGDNSVPSLVVAGAFSAGGAQIGNSGATTNNYELNSSTSYGHKTHTYRWGGRLREAVVNNTSVNNFGGSFTFQAGTGPALDANNQVISGPAIDLSALEVYRRTLLFQQQGLSDAAIRNLGGGAYQFSLSAGQPTIDVQQFDAGLFFADDWRARPNLTVSYGLRYETQNNISDHHDFAPRVAVAWNVGAKANKPSKTVLRAGIGGFYNRIGLNSTLNARRYNGFAQQQFVIFSPSFFPTIPSVASLQSGLQPQQIQILDSHIIAPQTWQVSVGADRQINKYMRVSANYNQSRGVHLQRTRDVNAPFPGTFTVAGTGVFPFGDNEIRLLTESTGFSRTQQLTITPSINYKTFFLAGYYTLSYGKSDNEGQPADPYNLRAEWGPATYNDTRHRAFLISNATLPGKVTLSMSFNVQSGSPYNITTGRDVNGDTAYAERPGLVTGIAPANCVADQNHAFIYEAAFGCFDTSPAPGTSIPRNFARGPAQVSLSYVSVSRSWILGAKEGPQGGMVTVPGPGGTTVQIPASMAGGLGGQTATRKYTLTLNINAQNPLNHTTYTAPSGDLSSGFFGVFRSTSNGSTYNRQVTLQLRLSF